MYWPVCVSLCVCRWHAGSARNDETVPAGCRRQVWQHVQLHGQMKLDWRVVCCGVEGGREGGRNLVHAWNFIAKGVYLPLRFFSFYAHFRFVFVHHVSGNNCLRKTVNCGQNMIHYGHSQCFFSFCFVFCFCLFVYFSAFSFHDQNRKVHEQGCGCVQVRRVAVKIKTIACPCCGRRRLIIHMLIYSFLSAVLHESVWVITQCSCCWRSPYSFPIWPILWQNFYLDTIPVRRVTKSKTLKMRLSFFTFFCVYCFGRK